MFPGPSTSGPATAAKALSQPYSSLVHENQMALLCHQLLDSSMASASGNNRGACSRGILLHNLRNTKYGDLHKVCAYLTTCTYRGTPRRPSTQSIRQIGAAAPVLFAAIGRRLCFEDHIGYSVG